MAELKQAQKKSVLQVGSLACLFSWPKYSNSYGRFAAYCSGCSRPHRASLANREWRGWWGWGGRGREGWYFPATGKQSRTGCWVSLHNRWCIVQPVPCPKEQRWARQGRLEPGSWWVPGSGLPPRPWIKTSYGRGKGNMLASLYSLLLTVTRLSWRWNEA